MLLVIDIGNTNVVLGLFEKNHLYVSWRLSTNRERTADEYSILLRNLFSTAGRRMDQVEDVLISSVVPPLDDCFEKMVGDCFQKKPTFVEADSQDLMSIDYEPVSDVGADRIVNSLAAFERYGGPAIVVDFGTATTFDVIAANGVYSGGVIAPGAQISAEALFTRAARLPRIDIRRPNDIVGRSTVDSMRSGLFYGYIGLVEGILSRLKEKIGGDPAVIATGGLAQLIGREVKAIQHFEPDLTLYGLASFYARSGLRRP